MDTPRSDHPVRRAVETVGSFDALARLLGVTRGAVWQWTEDGRGVPLEHCAQIERHTKGAVTRIDLRPDDWHRIWPELIGTEGAPPVPATPTSRAANG